MIDSNIEPNLKSSLNRNELILHSAGEGICGIDIDGKISFANPAATEILGWKDKNFVGFSYRSVFFGFNEDHYDDLTFSPIEFALFDGESSQVSSETFCRHDNSTFLVEYICVPLIENKKIIGAVVTFQDINERSDIEAAISEARDAALESARTKMAFLANMSHEIRTPLNGIIGMSGFLVNTKLMPEQLHYANVIKNSAEFLLQIVNEILDFSKIEAGKLQLEITHFNLRDLVSGIIEFFKSEARKKGLNLRLEMQENFAFEVLGDSNRLRQVLNNLISNAIKFTENGEIILKLELQNKHSDVRQEVKFSVSDTGIGILKDKQDFLFEPFMQADISTTRKFGGTGLGLAISKQLVNMMGGEIGVESEIEKGSVFWFYVPFEFAVENINNETEFLKSMKATSLHNLTSNSQHSFTGNRILIAEDNDINRQVAIGMLKKFGLEIDLAKNGYEAIEQFKISNYDLIFMDCQMPEMDGFQATREIRKLDTKAKKVIIIAMTASVLEIEKEKCLASGMDNFLGKPFSVNDLEDILIKYLVPQTKILDSNTSFVQHYFSRILEENALANLIAIEEGGEKNFVVETLNLYFEQANLTLVEIENSINDKDVENLIRKAHLLRGSSGSVGFTKIFQLSSTLEDSAEMLKWNNLGEIYKEITDEVIKSQKVIADFKLLH